MAKTYHFRSQLCPACGYLFEAAGNAIGEGSPKPGDYSLCLSCGTVLEYGDKGKMLIAPEPLELPLEQLIGVRKIQRFIRERGPLQGLPRPQG
jgi:hypothetical protein